LSFILYDNIAAFNNDVRELLCEDETKNMVFLGNLSVGLSDENHTGWRDSSKWVMASVKRESRVVIAALMLPEDRLQLCTSDDISADDFVWLVAGFKDAKIAIPGVSAEHSLAEMYANSNGAKYSIVKRGRTYRLEHFSREIDTSSRIRLAENKDLSFLPFWWVGFFESAEVSDNFEAYARLIREKTLYILENEGIPVSMARIDQRLNHVCGLGMIYTPPYFRNKGYATKITASLTKLCLDNDYVAALSTDLANHTSNYIYQKIGYRAFCDTLEIDFLGDICD